MLGLGASVARVLRRRTWHHVTLYGKPGCHLCEDARALLDRLGADRRFQLEEVDITTDPELFRRYDIRIPVILIDGAVELEAPIRESALRQALRCGAPLTR